MGNCNHQIKSQVYTYVACKTDLGYASSLQQSRDNITTKSSTESYTAVHSYGFIVSDCDYIQAASLD